MTAADAWITAFQTREFTPAAAMLAEDVAFRSPVLARPWRGREVLERLGPAMIGVFDDATFTARADDPGGDRTGHERDERDGPGRGGGEREQADGGQDEQDACHRYSNAQRRRRVISESQQGQVAPQHKQQRHQYHAR